MLSDQSNGDHCIDGFMSELEHWLRTFYSLLEDPLFYWLEALLCLAGLAGCHILLSESDSDCLLSGIYTIIGHIRGPLTVSGLCHYPPVSDWSIKPC